MEKLEIPGYGASGASIRAVLRGLLLWAALGAATVAGAAQPAAAAAGAAGDPGGVPPAPGQIVPVPVDVPIRPGAACQVWYSDYASGTGYASTVVIANAGTAVIQGWTLAYPLRAGQTVVAVFNATATLTDGLVVARNLPDNGVLASGQALSVHFWGSRPAGSAWPDWFTVNDVPCALGG